MSILRSRKLTAAALLAAAVTLATLASLMPGHANAATAEYPGGNASTFATGNGGWTSQAHYGGVCLPSLTCPELSGSYQSSGGAAGAGDGYIRTDSGATTVASLLSTSTHVWRSPAFTYNGVGGNQPEQVRFSVGINPNVTALLNLGVGIEVSARAVAVSGGGDQVLIDAASPGTASGWKTLHGEIGPGALEVGKQYRIELSFSIGGLAAVLPSGWIGFDDVSLRATRNNGNGNGNGGGNGNGNGGGNGPGKVLPPPKNVPGGHGYYYRGRLFVRVRCPARFRPVCRVRAAAVNRLHRGFPMTRPVRVRVPSRSFRRVALVVKPRFRKRIRRLSRTHHKAVILRMNINSNRGKRKGNAFHSLRVLQRRR